MEHKQISFFDVLQSDELEYESPYEYKGDTSMENIFEYYNKINIDAYHKKSNDDICTPMECVKKMIDYIPNDFWENKNLKILDPCCGNGNFGAYCKTKTSLDNIWFFDINKIRLANCKKILNPKHIQYLNAFEINSYNEWDLIMANPPYSGGGNKNKSISNQFIDLSIELLKNKGFLCFITPNNWMTYNNNNTTLKSLLTKGSFIIIDNDAKKYFPNIGSSFTIFVWQKGVKNATKIINNYLVKDTQEDVIIPSTLPFLPLYISQNIINIIEKSIQLENNKFNYRCDLHNFTQKDKLSDVQTEIFRYETIHTARKTRYAKIKQNIYDKWIIIVPLSTYYIPFIKHHVNVTQSVGYLAFETEEEAENYKRIITQDHFKLIVHLTRYGNFNNIMVLKHLAFDTNIIFTDKEKEVIELLTNKIKY